MRRELVTRNGEVFSPLASTKTHRVYFSLDLQDLRKFSEEVTRKDLEGGSWSYSHASFTPSLTKLFKVVEDSNLLKFLPILPSFLIFYILQFLGEF